MDRTVRARQRVLAVFLPLAALLYAGAEALNPKGTDKVVQTTSDALKILAIAAKHAGQLYVSGSLSLLALGALAVAYAGIATLVRDRGAALAQQSWNAVLQAERPAKAERAAQEVETAKGWSARVPSWKGLGAPSNGCSR